MGTTEGYKWVNKNGDEKKVSFDQLLELLRDGWKFGRTEFSENAKKNMSGKIGVNKNGEEEKVDTDQV